MKTVCKIYVESCVHGYHNYKDIRDGAVGEELSCKREPNNMRDSYTVAVVKDDSIVGHVPKKISRVSWSFLRKGGMHACTVTERRCYSSDLSRSGMEIPSTLQFTRTEKEIAKVLKLLSKLRADDKG